LLVIIDNYMARRMSWSKCQYWRPKNIRGRRKEN